jgi:2-(1,2-epoxy-1,2-dihydrophenyl)acetyl-CoA isomerase
LSYQSIDVQVREGIARVALNQPEIGNPFNEAFCREWVLVADELSLRTDVRVVLIRAEGRYFSVGGDIGMFAKNLDDLPLKIRHWTAGLHTGLARFSRLDAPIVAAVHATAMGGAVALIAGCDLVYAARGAKFGSAYTGIGYSVDAGASYALAARMGIARARRYVLCAEVLVAEEAAAAGLVDFVVDDATLPTEAEKAALRLGSGPTRAYGEIRRLFRKSLAQPLEAQLEDEAQGLSKIAATADAREGILSFVQKRKAVFVGK